MFKPHTKFNMSTITCNEEMKINAKCRNFHFEPPFGDLGVTYDVHLWLHGKCVFDFLLAIIDLFSNIGKNVHGKMVHGKMVHPKMKKTEKTSTVSRKNRPLYELREKRFAI